MRKWGWFSVAWAIQAAPMALTGGVAPALAASDSSTGITANSQQASETEVLQEITIVAQRRRENLQDVPISVTAISGSQLAHSGVESTQDLPMSVPGLTMPQSAGYLLPHIRGVGTTTMGAGLENSVATYIDGVYIASPTAALLKFNDIQQVEVLKGPQGTLFGRNATGGAILIATREPAQDLQGEAHLGYGNYATLDSNLYVNGGISNDIAANLAVNYVRMGEGYGTNIFNGQDLYRTDRNLALRSAWKFDFSDVATLVVSLDYENTAGNMNSSIGEAKGVIPLFGALPPLRSVWDADVDTQPYERFSGGGASAKLTYDLGFGHLVSITAYRRSDYRVGFDGDETKRLFPLHGAEQRPRAPQQSDFAREIGLSGVDDLLSFGDYAVGLRVLRLQHIYLPRGISHDRPDGHLIVVAMLDRSRDRDPGNRNDHYGPGP